LEVIVCSLTFGGSWLATKDIEGVLMASSLPSMVVAVALAAAAAAAAAGWLLVKASVGGKFSASMSCRRVACALATVSSTR
jgi:hypothetical protein